MCVCVCVCVQLYIDIIYIVVSFHSGLNLNATLYVKKRSHKSNM